MQIAQPAQTGTLERSRQDEFSHSGLLRTLGDAWRMALPYFRSDEKRVALGLLAVTLLLQLGVVGYDVASNFWRNSFFESVQAKDAGAFVRQLLYFLGLGVIFVVCTTYQAYFNQGLQVRWRRWQSHRLVEAWLHDNAHYRLSTGPNRGDNPDQRIADDVRVFVRLALSLTVGLASNVVSMLSFVLILWNLSEAAPLSALGWGWNIPGYLVWMALLYAIVGTLLTHVVGRRLIPIEVKHDRVEGDYRHALVRVRDHAEPVALLGGGPWETRHLDARFAAIFQNTHALMRRKRNLDFFTASHRHVLIVVPYVLVGPLYFAGRMTFGTLMQTGSAFVQVSRVFSYFVSVYASMAELAAVVRRLQRLEVELANDLQRPASPMGASAESRFALSRFQLKPPHGAMDADRVVATIPSLQVGAGDLLAITGTPGAGKTSLMRAAAGLWQNWHGALSNGFTRPAYVAQVSYLPLGSLVDVLAYPDQAGQLSSSEVQSVVHAVGLGYILALHDIDDAAKNWSVLLSAGERQRLGIARAILRRPDVMWLDEAFVSLPDQEARQLLQVIRSALPSTAIILLGHDLESTLPAQAAVLTLNLTAAPSPNRQPEYRSEVDLTIG